MGVNLNDYSEGSPLESYFNQNSFNQAFTQFENNNAGTIRNLTITDAEIRAKGITSNSSGELDNSKNNWDRIVELLENKYGNVSTAKERIIFLINNRKMTGYAGFANTPLFPVPAGTRYSIFMFHSALTDWESLAHEIGHTFGLQHPFETTGYLKGNTTNFMDYNAKKNMFWKWQWKKINTKDF